ncbi:hypothetical protein DMA11_15985 [Marinilabiliaceae bacterium JC017]|nr:hypothetical protein DMA11_15985 [Marinilabiliaceae bacterium JC017]
MIKKYYTLLPLLALFITITSCEKLDMEDQPGTDNVSIFNEYWTILHEKYGMLEAKGVNWNEVYSEYAGYINNSISKDSLSNVLGRMTLLLRDGHTWLVTNAGKYYYNFDLQKGYPIDLNRKVVKKQYLGQNYQNVGDSMAYSILPPNIGLVVYRDFQSEITDEGINGMLTDLKDTRGLIIDVRGNGGGDPEYAGMLASHFTEEKVYTGYELFKTGPGENAFSKSEVSLRPTNGVTYLKPIAILTDRGVFSATTTLLYMTDPLPQVFTVGAKSGGGSGSTSDGQLANGWIYSLSVSEYIDAKERHLDDGVMPDVEAHLNTNHPNTDEIIERAIMEIMNR